MPFRQTLLEKLNEALLVGDPVTNTNRDARLWAITGKVCTAIGMIEKQTLAFELLLRIAKKVLEYTP